MFMIRFLGEAGSTVYRPFILAPGQAPRQARAQENFLNESLYLAAGAGHGGHLCYPRAFLGEPLSELVCGLVGSRIDG